MKIGILTLPLHTNYGGILQAYALQTVLERMGHDAELIHIGMPSKKRGLAKRWAAYSFRFLRNLFSEKKTEYYAMRMYKHTDWFIRQYIHRNMVGRLSDVTISKYDVIVVGSDQIWRRQYLLALGLSVADAFGDTLLDSPIKHIAYAASFGVDFWEYTEAETVKISRGLNGFTAVSVREDSGVNLCSKLGIYAKHVIDPTMLLDKSDYLRLVDNSKIKTSRSGIMTYILDMTLDKEALIHKVAKEKKLNFFATNNSKISDPNAKLSEKQQLPLEQWLKGFDEAEFVITDSFHACVFSILFGKPFIAIGNAERGMARFKSLLKMFGLEQHLILDTADYDSNFDYSIGSDTIERLNLLRQDAYAFLNDALVSK